MTRLAYYLLALALCACLAGCCCCVPFGGSTRSRPASITVDPYPGARRIGSASRTTSWTGSVSTTSVYVASAPLAKVAAFYENDRHIRAKSGWVVTSKSVEMYGSSAGDGNGTETATIDRRAGNVRLSIGLAAGPDGNTRITVTRTAPR